MNNDKSNDVEESELNELEQFVSITIEETIKVYESEMFPNENSIFHGLHEIMTDNKEDHNCLGCNLDELTIMVYSTLLQLNSYVSVIQKMQMLIITMYLLVERIDTILEIIKLNEEYRKDEFKTFNKIRKWANFVKHPKAFIFAHHPISTIVGYDENSLIRKEAGKIIDNSFVFKFYSNNDHNKSLFKELANKEDVVVLFPNPIQLTKKFCNELKLFNKLLKNNEIYRILLKKRSTFLGFWENEEE